MLNRNWHLKKTISGQIVNILGFVDPQGWSQSPLWLLSPADGRNMEAVIAEKGRGCIPGRLCSGHRLDSACRPSSVSPFPQYCCKAYTSPFLNQC